MTQPKPSTVVTIISVVVLVVGVALTIGSKLVDSGGFIGAASNRLKNIEELSITNSFRIRVLEEYNVKIAVIQQRLSVMEVKINKTGDKVDAMYIQIIPYAERNRDKP